MNASFPLSLGTATRPLPIQPGRRLLGYPNSDERTATGLLDPLEVCAFCLSDGSTPCMLLSADIIGTERGHAHSIRMAIEAATGIPHENILICSTHTHSSGATIDLGPSGGVDAEFLDTVTTSLVEAARAAAANCVPVRIEVGQTEADLGHNRRVVTNGKAENIWKDPEHRHTGPVDKRVFVMGFYDEADNLKGLGLNVTCHPVALGPGARQASADFPGYARRHLRERFPGLPLLYTTGAAGDINPYDGLRPGADHAREMGQLLANAVLDSLTELEPVAQPLISCQHRATTYLRKSDGSPEETDFHLLTLGNSVAFLSLPGEPLVEMGLELKHLSRFPHTVILGYTNDYRSYLVTAKAVEEGGYEARQSFNDTIEAEILSLGRDWLHS